MVLYMYCGHIDVVLKIILIAHSSENSVTTVKISVLYQNKKEKKIKID